jgi:DNA anti-recombination protein RmuC
MSEKDLGKGLENFESEVEDLKNKQFRIFGIKVTAVTVTAAFTLLSTIIGSLYGAFVVYQDYMNMKQAIQEYVAPDLSGINERLSVIQKQMEGTRSSVMQSTDYTNEIKNDLKSDIRRLEGVVENLERYTKQSQREVDETVKTVNKDMNKLEKEMAVELRTIRSEVDSKIKKALDNPLATK